MKEILYDKDEANALTFSEKKEPWRHEAEVLKAKLILDHTPNINSLLDIGCAWGQTLRHLVGKVPVLAGVDECKDRIKPLEGNEHNIDTYLCSSTELIMEDNSFDAVLMSHILHELKLFGKEGELNQSISEVKRVLKDGGKYIVIDHRDPGEGAVTIDIGNQMATLEKFCQRFELRKIKYQQKDNLVEMSTRDCHDFVTKIWSLDKGAEHLEMIETHTVINADQFSSELESHGFSVQVNLPFNPITNLMHYYGIRLLEGDDWGRQIFLLSDFAHS